MNVDLKFPFAIKFSNPMFSNFRFIEESIEVFYEVMLITPFLFIVTISFSIFGQMIVTYTFL